MGSQYFRCKKDNFLWREGAILKRDDGDSTYGPVDDSSLWNYTDARTEYIPARNIEKNPDWFEEVYKVNLISKCVYKVKEEALKLFAKDYDNG